MDWRFIEQLRGDFWWNILLWLNSQNGQSWAYVDVFQDTAVGWGIIRKDQGYLIQKTRLVKKNSLN